MQFFAQYCVIDTSIAYDFNLKHFDSHFHIGLLILEMYFQTVLEIQSSVMKQMAQADRSIT